MSRSSGSADSERMDTVGCEPVCRWPFATLPTRRFADPKAVAAFRGGWYEGSNRCVQAPPSRGSSGVQEETSVRRTPAAMGQVGSSPPLPTSRPHHGNSAEVGSEPSPGNATHPGLATSGVVREGVSDGEQGHAAGSSSTGYLGGVQDGESEVAPPASGSELRVSVRAAHRLQLADSVIERLGALPSGPGMHKAASLLRDFAWSDRTAASRNSQWKCWVEYCDAARLAPRPVSEAHLIGFIEWLAQEREANRRRVGSTSLPQYISAMRQMQQVLMGVPVPNYALVPVLL